MFRKQSRLEQARRRLKKRWFFDRRSTAERISDALVEIFKTRR